jgi:hypothetical protein
VIRATDLPQLPEDADVALVFTAIVLPFAIFVFR